MKLNFFSFFTLILLLIVGCSEDEKSTTEPDGDLIGDGSGNCASSLVTLETAYYSGSGAMSYYPSATCEGTSSIGWCGNPLTPSTQEECSDSYGEYSCVISGQSWTFHGDCTYTWSVMDGVAGTWSEDSNGILMTAYDICVTDTVSTTLTEEDCLSASYIDDGTSEGDCINHGGTWDGTDCVMVGGYWIGGGLSEIGTDLSKEIMYDDACISTVLQTTQIECEDNVSLGNR